MKKAGIIISALFLICNITKAQDTLYMYKTGSVVYKRAVLSIDSISFTKAGSCGETVTDINGNVYNTVLIGNQCWMSENLKVTKYRNGNSIPGLADASSWYNTEEGAYCNYDNVPYNSTIYGRLYNFYAVTDPRNICPAGWHVATDEEWTTLTTYLGANAGGKLKEAGTNHWYQEICGGTCNETGFTALPGGHRWYDGSAYYLLTYVGYFWSPTASGQANYRRITHYSSDVERNEDDCTYGGCTYGMSVRCIK